MAETKKKTETTDDMREKKLVPYTVPLTYKAEEDAYPLYASFNFKNYLLKRGETVMIPKGLAERFAAVEEARREAYEYAQKTSLEAAERKFNALT